MAALSAPGAVEAGDSVRVIEATVNSGGRRAPRSVTRYLLSKDAKRNAPDLKLGRRAVKPLAPGKRSRGAATLTIPLSTPAGSHRLLACADDTRKARERNERNNCRASAAFAVQAGGGGPGPPPPPPDGIYASPSGDDAAPGTPSAPKRTLGAAIAAAGSAGKDVYAEVGDYPGTITLASGVDVNGGYSPAWQPDAPGATTVTGAPAVVAASVSNVTLDDLSLHGQRATGHSSAYAIRATGSSLVLRQLVVSVEAGLGGAAGPPPPAPAAGGQKGGNGNPGAEDSGGFCTSASRPLGGVGGSGAFAGGKGGDAGHGGNAGSTGSSGPGGGGAGGTGTPPGMGNTTWGAPYVGGDGADGADGPNGQAGAPSFGSAGYQPAHGGDGGAGTPGKGGGGGGGGGGGDDDCDSYGGSGSGGGGGAFAGTGGQGGDSGGASIAIYLWNSTVTLLDSSVSSGAGGDGGAGAAGQQGGTGGPPGDRNLYGGSDEQDDGSNGAVGGSGGDGGDGGFGGGGAGGASIGILAGGGSALTQSGNMITPGAGGSGGTSGGNPGPSGISVPIFTSAP